MSMISLVSHMISKTSITQNIFFIIIIDNIPIDPLIKVNLKQLFLYLFWKKYVITVTFVVQDPGGKPPWGIFTAHQEELN